MWNAVTTRVGTAYDKNPGDREKAIDDGRFEPMKIEVSIFKGLTTVKVLHCPRASAEDSKIAIVIEALIKKHFIFEKPSTPKSKVKQLDDGKTIDI